ncbi:phosphotransferase, putative, partial [Ricinus communis]
MSSNVSTNRTGVDWTKISAWMNSIGLPPADIQAIEPLSGGTQNLMFRFQRAGRSYVLRRPPLHKRAKSDDAMRREIRLLQALADQPVPHPRLVAANADVELIGAVFYVMEAIDGFNALNGMPDLHRGSAAIRHQMGLAMVDGLAALGAVDAHAVGLGDLGNPANFLQRQPQRWLDELESYCGLSGYPRSELPDVGPIAAWLTQKMPSQSTPGLMHGDFHIANVMFSNTGPELAAIVDWEMCTLGDPLLDLGWMLATWPALPPNKIVPDDGFPTKRELIERYASRSSRSLEDICWYE